MDNPVVLHRPVLSLNPAALATGALAYRAVLNDKHTRLRIPITHQIERFVICGAGYMAVFSLCGRGVVCDYH